MSMEEICRAANIITADVLKDLKKQPEMGPITGMVSPEAFERMMDRNTEWLTLSSDPHSQINPFDAVVSQAKVDAIARDVDRAIFKTVRDIGEPTKKKEPFHVTPGHRYRAHKLLSTALTKPQEWHYEDDYKNNVLKLWDPKGTLHIINNEVLEDVGSRLFVRFTKKVRHSG